MLKTLAAGAAIVTTGLAVVLVWGWQLPATASATRTALIRAPVDVVFARVADPAGQAAWRRDVAAVTVDEGGRRWTENTAQGIAIHFTEITREEPERYSIAFASPQGFTGKWEGVFAAEGGETRVTFTETVTTPGLVGRILARLFAPPGAHVDRYLADLKAAVESP